MIVESGEPTLSSHGIHDTPCCTVFVLMASICVAPPEGNWFGLGRSDCGLSRGYLRYKVPQLPFIVLTAKILTLSCFLTTRERYTIGHLG